MTRLTGSEREFYRHFARHGQGDTLVEITPQEVALLAAITYLDLHDGDVPLWLGQDLYHVAIKPFFDINANDVAQLDSRTEAMALDILRDAGVTDFASPEYHYLTNLAMLYRRRAKYYRILSRQPFPTSDQIGPRCLLEYGRCESRLLFSWMSWRKLCFDLDNRSAQETGYLFEPIIASCLGGESVGSSSSVVRRLNDDGEPTSQGRQIDCYVRDTGKVYELKMRMTIAASGQGRFGEELSFPREAAAAGLTPVLIVFDPTPSNRLEELCAAYEKVGGESAVGDDAWALLKSSAEHGMSTFIEKYIEPPINAAKGRVRGVPNSITLQASDYFISISSGDESYQFPRVR